MSVPAAIDTPRLRLAAARALAWALLISGWIALAGLAALRAAGPLGAAWPVALWLLALGLSAHALGRWRMGRVAARAGLLAAAAVAAFGWRAAAAGDGMLGAALPSALLLAGASSTVRALRMTAAARPGPPMGAAALGAVLAWAVVGNALDPVALAGRMALLALVAGGLLALLHPGAAGLARPGCRAGLFDCSLPAWPAAAHLTLQQAPLQLASLVMLPMMCGLPQMLALCRSAALPPAALLALHLAAMFGPALLLQLAGRRFAPGVAARACAVLLAAGAGAAVLDGTAAALWLALAQGGAWSLAWATQLAQPALRAAPRDSAARAACGQAALALVVGLFLAWRGPAGLAEWQFGAAALAGALLVAQALRRLVAGRRIAGA